MSRYFIISSVLGITSFHLLEVLVKENLYLVYDVISMKLHAESCQDFVSLLLMVTKIFQI